MEDTNGYFSLYSDIYRNYSHKIFNIKKVKMVNCWRFGLITLLLCTTTDAQLLDGPIISTDSDEIILEKGKNYTLFCKSKLPINFKQQEIPEDVIGSFRASQRNLNVTSTEYPYQIALDLSSVDQFAIGYYACYDKTVNSADVLNDLTEEPKNTEHISYIYIYVNGTDSLFAPMRENIKMMNKSKLVIGCKPITPDIKIRLISDLPEIDNTIIGSKIGFTIDSDVLADVYEPLIVVTCNAERQGYPLESVAVIVQKFASSKPPNISADPESTYYLEGDTFSLICTTDYQKSVGQTLIWVAPREGIHYTVTGNDQQPGVEELKSVLTVQNASRDHEGNYTCTLSSSYIGSPLSSHFTKTYLERGFIELTPVSLDNPKTIEEGTNQRLNQKIFKIKDYPHATLTILRNDMEVSNPNVEIIRIKNQVFASIRNLTVTDSGNYTLVAKNKDATAFFKYELRVQSRPIVELYPKNPVKCVLNESIIFYCNVIGYPLPNIVWNVSEENYVTKVSHSSHESSVYNRTETFEIIPHDSVEVTCRASNKLDPAGVIESRALKIYESESGFTITNKTTTWYPEYDFVTKECLVSKYEFVNVTWRKDNITLEENIRYYDTKFSHVAKLELEHIFLNQSGEYICVGFYSNGTTKNEFINIEVEAVRPPVFLNSISSGSAVESKEVYSYQPVTLVCEVDAVPKPTIEWFKDDVLLENTSKIPIITRLLNKTFVNSTVEIRQVLSDSTGRYKCVATSGESKQIKLFDIVIKDQVIFRTIVIASVLVIVLLIILAIYLIWKIRKEKQFKRELKEAGLYFFKKGVTSSLNPELMLDEQADLLPYDDKFEFPKEKLIFGAQLGAGAFGVVYKAEARGIVNAEETTPVAVKVVKKTADNQCIKALASELKIMVHLGKHINIVNLLGACTKNVGKRELMVIVEYCRYGNIHNYLQKHRTVFINTLTDIKESNGKVNRGYSCSSANSGTPSDYCGSNHTQETDHTFLNNTAYSNRTSRKVSESEYNLGCNYESDCSFEGRNPRPLYSRDLLCWAFQIARGMEYLASRKVLHGDLAARNILLADDNVVKICDFGLARSVYKNEEYQKKENCLLPVKWLAIECMTDRIFSTQSDVWSFGIVLWELFSLAKTPYPNISPQNLLDWLSQGMRLEKPPYADDRLYEVMRECWQHRPTARPSFTQLQEKLGNFLEDNVRNRYVDLNAIYIDLNKKLLDKEDYLDMVCAPDYNTMIAPSPHHYVNDNTFTVQLPQDDDGYLQVSSPRFDFDARKLNNIETNQHASERTPMLSLNNLPARSGSESDHDSGQSPYLKTCPRIDEEADEVFETNHNNLKTAQNRGVTNLTYLTLGLDKNSEGINAHNYINVGGLPNGLVT